jgi:6-phosphogluconolactonase (cycloisomerase 2 family)
MSLEFLVLSQSSENSFVELVCLNDSKWDILQKAKLEKGFSWGHKVGQSLFLLKESEVGELWRLDLDSEECEFYAKTGGKNPCHHTQVQIESDIYDVVSHFSCGTLVVLKNQEIEFEFCRDDEQTHRHFSAFSPCGRYILSVDMGCDVIDVFAFEKGICLPISEFHFAEGVGPRHLTFDESGVVWVSAELSSEVYLLSFECGILAEIDRCESSLKLDKMDLSKEPNYPSHIECIGEKIILANRGINSLVQFKNQNNRIEVCREDFLELNFPRHFSLQKIQNTDGFFAIVGGQKKGCIQAFEFVNQDCLSSQFLSFPNSIFWLQ